MTAQLDAEQADNADIAALARGGRTNFLGFLLRLAARLPFLFIAGRLYGAEALGRFASAMVMIELAGQLCTLGQKRGLAQRLSEDERRPANIIADGMVLSLGIAVVVSAALYLFPEPMFPSGHYTEIDRLLVTAIFPATLTDIALAALAYRYDVATTVRSRSVVEPWSLSIAAGLCWYAAPHGMLLASGLSIAYILSIYASALAALVPLLRSYGLPRQWRPHPLRIARLALSTMPLAAADAVEWGTRKLDIAILGMFTGPAAVGVYYVAQQVASLPQKLKTSFEPILGPVVTRNLKNRNYPEIARQVCQVGFWITAAQAGIALALGIPGRGVMGLVGPHFVGGTGALAFLLLGEVAAATAVVSEAVLIYIARIQNLLVSLATIALQALLTVGGILLVKRLGLGELYRDAAAAISLMLALGIASIVKSRMLSRLLDQPINNWRMALFPAVASAGVTGWLAVHFLPEWAELILGIPAILGLYCWVLWHKGFGPADRVLFRRNGGDAAPTPSDSAAALNNAGQA
ncbi:MAG: lipopolysaccharide biosynthesis protein [Pseudomonadota bacterium]|nr:lipopolysaccharide biosynthesis protein [Pseudomonadota bacterium]